MGRSPSSEKNGIKKGPWTPEEDQKLMDYIQKNGYGNWRTLPINAGLQRCGKSCRLRWTNYLRPDIKRGRFSLEEEETIIHLHSLLGNKWSMIAARLPGRTDNEIKNYWNTHIRKRLMRMGIDPVTHNPRLDLLDLSSLSNTSSTHMNLSRLLGLQNPYINIPELLRLFSSQNINQDFSLENQENQHLLQNNLSPLIQSTQIQTPIEDNIPYCSGPQTIMQPNNSDSAAGSEFSDVTLMPSNFQQGFVHNDQSYVTYEDLGNVQLNDINDFNFQSGPSNLSTPSSTPTGITSSSNYVNGSSTEDERESYCSNLKFNFPENMDDFKFMFPNCIDDTY